MGLTSSAAKSTVLSAAGLGLSALIGPALMQRAAAPVRLTMTLQLILSLSLQQMNMSLAMTALRLLTNSAVKLATVLSAAGPGLLTLTGPAQKLHAAALAKKAKNLKKPDIPALKSRLMAKKRLFTFRLPLGQALRQTDPRSALTSTTECTSQPLKSSIRPNSSERTFLEAVSSTMST